MYLFDHKRIFTFIAYFNTFFYFSFVDMEKKISQDIIYTLSSCGIVIDFDELFRSESCYITLWHLFKIIRLIDVQCYKYLPNTVIYDNACNLFMYFWNRYGKTDVNRRITKTS